VAGPAVPRGTGRRRAMAPWHRWWRPGGWPATTRHAAVWRSSP